MTHSPQAQTECPPVELIEVGPRDGFQHESQVVPTEEKIRIITQLADAGLGCIQVTAFVHPDRVPQMADAESVLAALPRREDTVYSGLVLNRRGLDRALATTVDEIEVSSSASDAHSRANTGQGWAAAAAAMPEMIQDVKHAGRRVRAGIQCAFGHQAPGDVPLDRIRKMVRLLAEAQPDQLALADTTGLAHPKLVLQTLAAVADIIPVGQVVLHFHDTRGLGLVNVLAAMEAGVLRFDTAFGGYGGCPAVPKAAGNVATEDLVYLLEHLGHATGVDKAGVSAVAREMAVFFGHPGTGRLSMLA